MLDEHSNVMRTRERRRAHDSGKRATIQHDAVAAAGTGGTDGKGAPRRIARRARRREKGKRSVARLGRVELKRCEGRDARWPRVVMVSRSHWRGEGAESGRWGNFPELGRRELTGRSRVEGIEALARLGFGGEELAFVCR